MDGLGDRLMQRSRKSGKVRALIADEMDNPTVVGNRLFKIRYVASLTRRKESQEAYAERLGFKPKSYSQWETGHGHISLVNAIKLCDQLGGVTLDYIYRGLPNKAPDWDLALLEAPDRPGFAPRPPLPRIEPKSRPRAPRRGR
jgi:transcriptional regulator with XRE-family HTH domain